MQTVLKGTESFFDTLANPNRTIGILQANNCKFIKTELNFAVRVRRFALSGGLTLTLYCLLAHSWFQDKRRYIKPFFQV